MNEFEDAEENTYQESGLVCEKCGYTDSIKCTIWGLGDGEDDTVTILCGKHAADEGYCCCCGEFCSGMTSFDFHHPGYCDNCYDEVKRNFGDDDDDDGYASYHFDNPHYPY